MPRAKKVQKSPVDASETIQETQSPVEVEILPQVASEPPETPIEDSETPAIVDAQFEEVLHEPPSEEPEEIQTTDPVELVAHCPHCGNGVKSEDWGKIASWFGEHCQQFHPEVFQKLFGVASAFLGLMIADMYETEPDWNDQPSMDVMREELLEILDGNRDPLEDGIS
jgi:hypothetical protein